MFTIKVVEEDGSEFVKSDVESVRYNLPTIIGKQASLFVWYKDAPVETFSSGKIYIMNENGKTVADYHLFLPPA